MAKGIEKLPANDRPYEKLELLGSENLTNSELLAIIIKTGTKEENCLEISRKILTSNLENISDLEYLNNLSFAELKKFKGIGRVKAIQIKAVLELAKRISNTNINNKYRITTPKDIFDLVSDSYIGKKQEIIKTIILDNSNKVLSIVTNAIGKTSSIEIGVKEILSEPLKQMASAIVLVHNHPSGNLTPSRNDINFTNKINEYANTFEIRLIDHLIIGKNEYLSLKEKGHF